MTNEPGVTSWRKHGRARCQSSGNPCPGSEDNSMGTTIVKEIREQQYHWRHVTPTSSSSKCPGKTGGPNYLELPTGMSEATNCLKPMNSSLARARGVETYTSLFPTIHLIETRKLRARVFVRETDKTQCQPAHGGPSADLARRVGPPERWPSHNHHSHRWGGAWSRLASHCMSGERLSLSSLPLLSSAPLLDCSGWKRQIPAQPRQGIG